MPTLLRRLLALALTSAAAASAQDSDAIFRETLFSPPFPIFESERQAQRPADGPWNRDVIVYRAAADAPPEKIATFDRAGVPTIARLKDGRLIAAHQHFPENDAAAFDKVAVHFSSDEGRTWTAPAVIQLTGLPEGMRFPFDPTLVPLPDGRVRLYFTSLRGRRFEEARPGIHSAISTDGIAYTYEPGVRFAIEGRPVIDCAVVLHQGVFHLFSPDNGARLDPGQAPGDEPPQNRPRDGIGYHATSTDGLNFTRADDVQVEGRRHWLGNAQSDGQLITFYGTGQPLRSPNNQSPGNLWIATSADGTTWQPAAGPTVLGGDPGAVTTTDNHLVIVITGEPRRRGK
ncbi:MAG: sialidase family protein [Prosthecobacter sp.]|nr:sialidase family protein [Prosthecobacter sp.]